jgi:peptide-methionine (S)-S-oxide reductase
MARGLSSLVWGSLAVAVLGWSAWTTGAVSEERARLLPPPSQDETLKPGAAAQTVVLAGGCFWGVQAVYQHLNGVKSAVSGYSGGAKDTAHYEQVSDGDTGHAESVEVTFDPAIVSYGTILRIFFSVAHDPTEVNRQGPDVGPQYRTEIFAADDGQRRMAEAYIAELDRARAFSRPIATKVSTLQAFYPAEAYHQDYATLHPENPYIRYNDAPKVVNLERLFPELSRKTPVLVSQAKP